MFIIVSVSTCKNAKLFPITQQKYCHFLKILYFCAEKHVKNTKKGLTFIFASTFLKVNAREQRKSA